MPNFFTDGLSNFVNTVKTTVETKQEEIRVANEAKSIGKIWDKEKKAWVFYFLDPEYESLQAEIKAKQPNKNSSGTNATDEKPVKDREYYDLLQVSTNADEVTIRKAYFKAARKCHPDKNPDDAEANAKFQKLGEAYQVLSQPQLRAAYDRDGKTTDTTNAAENMPNPQDFFNVMFGSALVTPYIGELWISSMTAEAMMNNADEGDGANLDAIRNDESLTEEEKDEKMREKVKEMQEHNEMQQKLRQVECARALRERIASFDAKQDWNIFASGAAEEAEKIAQSAYGSMYCITIGFAWQMAAEEYLGKFDKNEWFSGQIASARKGFSGIGSNFQLIGAGFKAASAGSKAMHQAEQFKEKQQEAQDPALQEQFMAETIDSSLPAFLNFAWAINKRDIQSTISKACFKLFHDASVPVEGRMERAKAVRILGKAFQKVGYKHRKEESNTAEDIKARVAVATMTSMAKAQGQEVTEEDQQNMMKEAKEQMHHKGQSATVANEPEDASKQPSA